MAVLPQARTEALLCDGLAACGVAPERGTALGSFEQDEGGVDAILLSADRSKNFRTPIMFAADGAHSKVRDALGVTLEGSDFPESWPLYDIELEGPLDADSAHVCFVEGGLVFLLRIGPGVWRVFGNMTNLPARLPPGTKACKVHWQSSFISATALLRAKQSVACCWPVTPLTFIHRLQRAA